MLTDTYYISRRQVESDQARLAVARCLREFGVLAVYRAVLDAALARAGADFEDDVQIACALLAHLDLIVTRDAAGFRDSPIPTVEPAAALGYLTP